MKRKRENKYQNILYLVEWAKERKLSGEVDRQGGIEKRGEGLRNRVWTNRN